MACQHCSSKRSLARLSGDAQPKSCPSGESYSSQEWSCLSISALLSHWLEAPRESMLSVNMVTDGSAAGAVSQPFSPVTATVVLQWKN